MPLHALATSWIVTFSYLSIGFALGKTALTGNLYSSGRGASRIVGSVRSVFARVLLLIVAGLLFSLFAWAAWNNLRELPSNAAG
jgi:hypothetical protein